MVRRRTIDPTESVAALFGYKLRQHRDLKKWTQSGLADRVGCSPDLISKIERADRGATPETSARFDELFGTGTQFQELQPLAARANIPGWFRRYAEYEQQAMSIRLFSPLLVPGLLQTEAYARTVLKARQPPTELDQLVAARLSRQA
ncbi:MAG: hypothetical protein JWL97_3684, partial [Gemmatimonadales bacterium]|nr:hypothetical protein [Gemmatimonadales bacterium]